MVPTLHKRRRLVVERILKRDVIRFQLVVEARLRQRFVRRHALVEHVPQVLHGGGYDAGAAGGAGGHVEFARHGVFDNGGGHGGEGTFAGFDVVCHGGDVAEGVGGAGDGEVCGVGGLVWRFFLRGGLGKEGDL